MKNIFKNLISTSRGWLVRQGLKIASSAGAAASTAILTHANSLPIDPSNAIELAAQTAQVANGVTGLAVSIGIALLEGVLSKHASKIAAK
jgi:hypothetical protein